MLPMIKERAQVTLDEIPSGRRSLPVICGFLLEHHRLKSYLVRGPACSTLSCGGVNSVWDRSHFTKDIEEHIVVEC